MRPRSSLAVVVLIVCAGAAPAQTDGAHRASRRFALICGPRCVEFILDWYGKKYELLDLVQELQGDKIYEPVSLAALADALRRRDIHSAPLRLKPGARWDWPYPVVVHLDVPTGHGHYVVWVPQPDGEPPLYWDETGYKREEEIPKLGRPSGVILLTGPVEIADPTRAVHGGNVRSWIVWGVALACLALGAVTAIGWRRRRRVVVP